MLPFLGGGAPSAGAARPVRREREEELEENEALPVEELSQGTRNLWRDLKEIKFRGKFL